MTVPSVSSQVPISNKYNVFAVDEINERITATHAESSRKKNQKVLVSDQYDQ